MTSTIDKEFVRLLGRIDFVQRETGLGQLPERDGFQWSRLPESPERPELYEDVRIAEDHEQPEPLTLQVLFQPEPNGIYDLQWIVDQGAVVAAGEPVVRGYRVSDGLSFTQLAAFPMQIASRSVRRNDRAVRGDEILTCQVPSLALDFQPAYRQMKALQIELAQAVNAAFKGLVAAEGQGGHIAKSVIPISEKLHPERGEESLLDEIVAALPGADLRSGDVVVVSESLFAIAQGRLFPLEVLYQFDPKTTDMESREDILELVKQYVPDVTLDDLLCADALPELSPPQATAGARDPNGIAYRLAQLIQERHERCCDVVVSDTDTGLEVRETLIGCPTVNSTPLGATGGLVIYECMRVANAAEFCRGASRGIGVVICRPHERRAERGGVGEPRGYQGRLDLGRERLIGYA